MKNLLFFVLLFCFSISAYCGEITEIELTDLTGTYVWRDSQISNFQFDHIPQHIYGMKILLVGVLSPGTQNCEGGQVGLDGSLGMVFHAILPDTTTPPNGRWVAAYQIETEYFDWGDIDFEVTLTLVPQNGATWDFLADGSGNLTIETRELFRNEYLYLKLDEPSCNMISATLIVDADIKVGTEQSSWGLIKSLMR